VRLSWTAVAGADSYNVYAGTSAGGENASPRIAGVTGSSTTVSGLYDSTTYYFTVAAVSGGATGARSNEASAATPAAPAPANLTAAASGANQITLSWTASPGALYYQVYQGSAAGAEASGAVRSGIKGTTVDIAGLNAGSTYYFRVTASVNGVVGPKSNEATAALALDPPGHPGAVAAAGKVTLNWTASPGAAGYNVYATTQPGGEGQKPLLSGISGTSVDVTGLYDSTTYYFKVAAISGGAISARSSEVSATTPAAPAPTMLAAAATADSTGEITLNWTAAPGAFYYRVYQGVTTGGESTSPVKGGITGTTTNITGLAPGTTYYFKLAASANGVAGPQSNEANAQAPETLSAWGDSLTYGGGASAPQYTYTADLARLLNHPVLNNGIGGETAAQIAARMGSVPAVISFNNDTMEPGAANPVTLSAIPTNGYNKLPGTVDGIEGILTSTDTSNTQQQFTPSPTLTQAHTVPANARFLPATDAQRSNITILWMGHDDYTTDPAAVASTVEQSIQWASSGKVIVLSLLNGENTPRGTRLYNQIVAINQDFAGLSGAVYIDIRSRLIAAYDPTNPQDVQDHANDIVPSSLRAGATEHLNDTGYAMVAQWVADAISQHGW
jgi:fibronectin type 3 domain-containing protein